MLRPWSSPGGLDRGSHPAYITIPTRAGVTADPVASPMTPAFRAKPRDGATRAALRLRESAASKQSTDLARVKPSFFCCQARARSADGWDGGQATRLDRVSFRTIFASSDLFRVSFGLGYGKRFLSPA